MNCSRGGDQSHRIDQHQRALTVEHVKYLMTALGSVKLDLCWQILVT
jgi:hypothetical protein